ncbi:hypothetical protein K505DRAFT_2640 [Melanomma pulvis-pyrius CBS 109.77]|uniref:Uncharacterized protein n=1 Tax=Melanomma pulvis-pyrius CBS 109.77 TaxID=1314802 RepID=A0A6A6XJA2_9PLEO|nr:hypothetical protein K505DRAFT_2640 [Melanomma pulvis-pyrius CBS 109.77]
MARRLRSVPRREMRLLGPTLHEAVQVRRPTPRPFLVFLGAWRCGGEPQFCENDAGCGQVHLVIGQLMLACSFQRCLSPHRSMWDS